MKKITLIITSAMLSMQVMATEISFSLDAEAAAKNTPAGWDEVQLPANLPAITAANTFVITDAPYNASTTSSDNTAAIQAALDDAANAGGGMVVIPAGEYLSSYLTIGSKTILHLCENATLKMLPITSFETDANGYHKMANPFITGKNKASDIVIEGESRSTSVIDGQGAPWWDEVEAAKAAKKSTTRSSLIRFWQGNRYLFRNFRIQNTPNTNITIGRSGNGAHVTAHDITIKNPSSTATDPSHNTDGFPIWTQYVNIYDCEIDTGDDNIVCDQDAQYVHVWHCDLKEGHGASFGSYTTNMHDIIYEDLTFTGTDAGFRLKSNKGRSGDVYNLTFRNCTMTNVANPISITCWYDSLPTSPAFIEAHPDELTDNTPAFHDILIQNVTASGDTQYKLGSSEPDKDRKYFGIFIYGRPESYVRNVTFDNVNLTHSKGLKLNFCSDITFKDCSITVYNTNKTAKNGSSTDDALPAVLIEQQYKGSFTWNGQSEQKQPDVISWNMGENGAEATVANAITGATGCAAEGYTIAITSNTSKSWNAGNGTISYSGVNYRTLKNSNGAQNTITLPAGKMAKKVEFYAVNNYTDRGHGALSEFNGEACSDSVYALADYNNPTRISKSFAVPVSEFTFTFTKVQVCFIAVITLASEDIGSEVKAVSTQQSAVSVQKVVRDGQLVIIRQGKEYNVMGRSMN